MLAVSLTILGIASPPAKVGIGSAAAGYLRPVMKSAGGAGAARINYGGVCPGQNQLFFPNVEVQPASQGATGITAVRQIFRNDPQVTIMQDESGIFRITIGSVSTSALRTRMPVLTLDSGSQYTPKSAVDTIAIALETYAVDHKLNFGMASIVIDNLENGPVEGAPHLPPLMQNVTVDVALDSVARTFKGIVLYGSCRQPDGKELFKIDYIYGS
ncbi:MAG: hypothetical protein WB615_02275 [Candidatus Tumulicola sp.]